MSEYFVPDKAGLAALLPAYPVFPQADLHWIYWKTAYYGCGLKYWRPCNTYFAPKDLANHPIS